MFKFALFGDLHYDEKNHKILKDYFGRLLEKIIAEKVNLIINLGDTFHNYNIAGKNETMGSIFSSFLEPLHKYVISEKIPMVILEGTHDQARVGQRGALAPLEKTYGVKIITEPQTIVGKELVLGCLPWYRPCAPEDIRTKNDLDNFYKKSCSDLIKMFTKEFKKYPDRVKWIIGHCNMSGAVTESGYIMREVPFEFTEEQLLSTGANGISFGHIHKRQGVYIGPPWQISFKDSGNDTGYQIVTIDDEQHIFSEYHQFDDAPKYFIFSKDEYKEDKFRSIDHVRVLGNIKKVVPSNVEIIPEVALTPTIKREKTIEFSDDKTKLFKEWLKINNIEDSEKYLLELSDIIKSVPDVSISYTGCIDRICKLQISGFGPHKDTEQDIENDDLIGISGKTGSGKTFLLEIPAAVNYNRFPTRKFLAQDYCTEDFGKISYTFLAKGKKYIASRIFKKVGDKWESEASLTEDGQRGQGPKLKDFDSAIAEFIGDKSVMMAGCMSCQTRAGDLVKAQPADRKEVLSKIFGIDSLLMIADEAGKRITPIKYELSSTQNELNRLSSLVNTLPEVIKQGREYKKTIESLKLELDKLQEDADIIGKEYTNKQVEYKVLQKEAADLNSFKEEHTETVKEKELLEKSVTNIVIVSDLAEKEQELRSSLEQLKEEYEEICNSTKLRSELAETFNGYTAKIEDLETTIAVGNKELQNCLKKKEFLKTVGCNKTGLFACVLIDDAKSLVDQIPKVEKCIEHSNKAIKILKNEEEYKNTIVLLKQLESEEHRDGITVLSDIDKITERLDSLKNLKSKQDLILLQQKEDKLKIKRLETEIEKLSSKIKVLDSIPILQFERELTIIIGNKASIAAKIDELTNKSNNAITELKLMEKEFLSINQAKIRKIELENKVATLLERVNVLEEIVKAFEKNGIPQHLISHILPRLNEILQELCGEFDNRYMVSLVTQKELKDKNKTIRETIDIIVVDNKERSRPVESYSGGEQSIVSIILRLGVGIIQVERQGDSNRIFLIDEAFDQVDPETSLGILRMIMNLIRKYKFNQVIVTSHKSDLLSNFPVELRITTMNDVASIERVI
jgi:DNA repair exonuclease SbcCD ATPase subunit